MSDTYAPIHNFRGWTHSEVGYQAPGTDSGVPPGDELERAIEMGLCERRDDGPEIPDDYQDLRSLAADVREETGEPYPDSMTTEQLTDYVKKHG